MKKAALFLLTAVVGGLIAVGLFYSLDNRGQKNQSIIHYLDGEPGPGAVSYEKGTAASFPDFTEASQKVMAAVVHIETSQPMGQSGAPGQDRLPDPFRDFFGDEFFRRYFGPGQDGQSERVPPPTRRGSGSGVILNGSGHIVTNNHVIAQAKDIQVTLHNNQTYQASVVGTDPSTDLALIRIDGEDLPYVSLVDSDRLQVGEWVLAIGNPFNLTSTVTAGIISAKARNINIVRDQYAIESFLQTDAAINPGNSGGALVTLQGGLVGINTAIASPTGAYSGYGFAVPSNIVSKVITDLMEFGVVQRGYLGVIIRNLDGNFAREEGLKVTEGAYIDSVLEKSAAQKAGIKEGDVITSIDGKQIRQSSQLLEQVARYRPGETLEIVADRQGKKVEMIATLQSREGNTKAMSKDKAEVLGLLGAEFEDISAQTARELGIKGGVRVQKIHAGILKQQTNMREGFIITKVNNNAVGSLKEFISSMENRRGGIMLEGVYEDIQGSYYYAFGL